MPNPYYRRDLESVVLDRMRDEPVILIQGPRAVGKSTLLRSIASQVGGTILDFDDEERRAAYRDDLATVIGGPKPILIDEYQRLPEVLQAIKAQLNRDGSPGQYLLTGSARHESLPRTAQALTGRLHRVDLYPLSQAEIAGTDGRLLGSLLEDFRGIEVEPESSTTREEYVEAMVRGGLPPALRRDGATARGRWHDDYVRLTLERDVEELSRLRQAEALPRLFSTLAGQTAQVLNVSKLARACGVGPGTGASYLRVLEALFLVRRLPAWGRTLRSRAAKAPKVHLVDSGIAARQMRLTAEKLTRPDSPAYTEIGHLLETFVVGELLRQASLLDGISGVGHWRTHDGHEVDLVVERDDGAVLAFEVKVGGRVDDATLRPLTLLHDALGDAFIGGVILNLGRFASRPSDRIRVMPVDRLWLAG